MKEIQKEVADTFLDLFGETPTEERVADISREAGEVKRAGTFKNLKKEMGQLLCSTLAGCSELELDAEKLIRDTLADIRERQDQYKALGRKTRVAILGGAFNPITNGHIKVAKYVLDRAMEFDEVWLAPCYGHMNSKDMASPSQRLQMVELAASVDRRLKPFAYEIDNELRGETYHFAKRLLADKSFEKYYNFSYIIGQDNANNFDRWVNFPHLQKLIRFVVVPRKGVEPDPKAQWYRNDFHICMPPSEEELIEISSTEVREMLKTGDKEVEKFLDPKVYEYIKKHGLYQS